MSRVPHRRVRSLTATGVPAACVRPSVLVVTDDGALAGVCRDALEQAGYEVIYASHSGHALLQCLKGHRADILLTDLSMPDGLGTALARRLRRYFPDMQAIYFAGPSSAGSEDARPEGTPEGRAYDRDARPQRRASDRGSVVDARNVLLRPFSGDDLLTRVRGLLTS